MRDYRWPGDEWLFHALNGLGIGWVDQLFILASNKYFIFAVALALVAWVAWQQRTRWYFVVAHVAAAVAITDSFGSYGLKPFFGRMRPSYALAEGTFRPLLTAANVGAMPSLHAANAFAVAVALTLWLPKAAWVAVPFAVLVAVSRIVVGVHWPSDILVGAVYGVAVGTGLFYGGRKLAGLQAQPQGKMSRR